MEQVTELLAPAKDKSTAIAAINSGCDAVYVGALNFGARHNASNSLEDIKEIVDYAHKFYVKVHVTVNTILKDDEIDNAKQLITDLYKVGVDAIIVQDMGIFKLALDNEIPPIVLHASTQCDNRFLDKVKFFESIGVSRVILARELPLEKIKEICANTNIEIETFIHGALCVSYSGQCYFSHYIGGRSANRGECAQACRKKYSLIDDKGNIIAKDKYLLSMKDFNASKHVETLVKAGVKSFKIEGRLKDSSYVKNIVAYYRKELDKYSQKSSSGKIFLDFEPDVNKSFNRGFTTYFLEGRNEKEQVYNFDTPKSVGEYIGKVTKVSKDWFEISTEKSLNAQDGLYFDGKGCLVNRVDKNRIYPNRMDDIKIGIDVFRNFDSKFEKQLTNSKTKRQIGVKFLYQDGILYAKDEDNNCVQKTIDQIEPANNPEKMEDNFKKQLSKTGDDDFYVQDIDINGILPFYPISQINELRRNILKDLMSERLKNYKREVQRPLKYAKYPILELDYRANIYNNYAKTFYENCGSKVVEKAFESGTKGDELMRTKHCLKYAFNICKSSKKLYLVDEKGVKYPLKFDCKNCEMIIQPDYLFGE